MRFLLFLLLYCAGIQAQTLPAHIKFGSWVKSVGNAYTVPCTDSDGGKQVIGLAIQNYMEYNIYSAKAQTYTLNVRNATMQNNTVIVFSINGVSIANCYLQNTLGWDKWKTYTVKNVSIPAGFSTLRATNLYVEASNLNWFEFVSETPVVVSPPTANAGNDTVIYFPMITQLKGSGTGAKIKKTWSLVSVNVPSNYPDSVTAGVIDSTVYTYRLTVTDSLGRSASDDVKIIVRYDMYQPIMKFFLQSTTPPGQKLRMLLLPDGTFGFEM